MSAKEIRFHGRGGQGAVLAAKMLASAMAAEGKCVASFPMYGFERRGFPDATLRNIAAKAGTTHNLIRHHFGSKDDLWKAVVDDGLRMREARLKQIIDSGHPMEPVELLIELVKSHVLFVAEHTELAKILMHSNSRTSPHLDYIIKKRQGVMDIVEPVFREAQKHGYFKDFDHDSFTVYMRALA